MLREFGVELDDDVELRVVDSTADIRYLVVPRRPENTEHQTEDELAALVTRDSMIGVAQPRAVTCSTFSLSAAGRPGRCSRPD